MQPKLFLLVFLGGGLGSVARFLMSTTVQKLFDGAAFPFGTFSVNMLGCLVIGTLGSMAESRGVFSAELRSFLFVGILGGFTTFSSFGFETFNLFRDGELAYALLNGFGQLALGFAFVWLGFILGRLI
jgi:CrcB protein